MDGILNRYTLESTRRIYTFGVLNERFPDAWIGRGGPIPWPPRSPDLSPLEFFLWGYIQNIVYAVKIRNIHHLQERITSAIETVTRDMIQKTWQEIEFCLDVSRATNGAHIEMHYGKSKTLNFSENFKTPNV